MKTKLKILHLEDIASDAELVDRELKKGNIQFEKLVVDNKRGFEKALEEFAPDIIIADHTLPSFDSFEALSIIKGKGIKIPTILVSATVSDEFAVEIIKAGADDYIIKDRLSRLPIAIANAMEKKMAEHKLHEIEILNNGVLSSLSTHIAIIDGNGTLIASNNAWNNFANENGITSLERVSTGSNYFAVCNQAATEGDEFAAKALVGIQSVFKTGKHLFEMEYPCHSPAQQQWFILTAVKFASDTDKVVISHQDITQRKLAENNLKNASAELQKTLSKLNQILDSSSDVICTINTNGEFVNVSAASQQVWGYSPEELIGRKFRMFVFDQDIDKTLKTAAKITSGIQVSSFENRFVHKNGGVVPLLWSINWDEKLGLGYCIAKDVTDRKRLEKAVESERDQFYNMFTKAPSAIGMLKGATHIFEMANPLYLKFIDKKDILGKTVEEVLPEVVEQGFVKLLDHVYLTGESYTGSEMLVKVDIEGKGELTDLYINIVYQAYRNSNGEIEGVFFFMNNVTEEILSRKELEKSEKQYRQIVETAQEGIWQLDKNNRIIFVNKKMCEILDYSEEEILGKVPYYFMDKDEKVKTLNALTQRKKGIAEKYELTFISKCGNQVHTTVSANPIFDDLGNYSGALGMISDVTEKKIIDEKNRFKANLLNTIGQSAIATDRNGVVIYWNKAAENIYGWTKQEAIGKHIIDLTISETNNEQAVQIMEELKKGKVWSGEFDVRKKDGTIFPALVTNSPIHDENNILCGVIGISSDITEKKKLEGLLDKSNKLARIGSWEFDVVNGTLYWSDIIKEIHEVEPDFVPDLSSGIGFFLQGTDNRIISERLKQCIDNGNPWDEELQISTFKGHHKWVRTIGQAEIVQGKCIKIYGSFQDITERKIAENERAKMIADIIQRNGDLEQFSFIISHNLRAPTANIIGFAEILKDGILTAQEQKVSLQGLSDSVKRLDTIIKDLNIILQNERKVHQKKEVVSFSKLVDDIMGSIGNLIENHHVRFITDFSEVEEIYSLKIYIHSIFYNLISNSIKYGKPNESPLIEIKSKKDKGKIILTFKDNGMGLDMKVKGDKIFGLYNRFHSHVEGKGMGLFMVKTQVELLGGKISMESELNKGTEFTIIFKI